MLILLSPAKTLDYSSPIPAVRTSRPRLLEESQVLVDTLRELSAAGMAKLMSVSENIAELNVTRYQEWALPFAPDNARPALYAFMGDVYTGLEAHRFTPAMVQCAQKKLRILSGLYGVLRPLDLMQPYRLEMGTSLGNARGSNLYQFWGQRITALLNRDLKRKQPLLVNLASNEYFRAVDTSMLKARVITPVFQDEKNGAFKVVSFYAKKARGMMAAWMLREEIDKVEDMTRFDVAGYRFSPQDSAGDTLVFRRRAIDLPRR